MKLKLKKRLKKYALDVAGGALVLVGVVSFPTFAPGSTFLVVTGLTLIIGKRGAKQLKHRIFPWLKKKRAARKKRKLTKRK